MPYDETTVQRLRAALAGRAGVVEKKLMGGLCFMVDGNMCINASRHGGILVRVGPEFGALAAEPGARTVRMGGKRMMTGFVYVEPEGYKTDAALKKWVGCALALVATLPAKKAAKGRAKKVATKPRAK